MLLLVERLALAFIALTVGFNLVTFAASALLSRRHRRLGALSVAFLKETLATLLMLPAWPLFALLGARYRAAHEGADPDGGQQPPIILLHGYMMNRTNWLWFGRALARHGLGPLYGFTYNSLAPVDASARRLDGFVAEVLRRERAQRVDIVAHSLGGLVSRYYIEKQGGAARVRRLVTIATPHHGTLLARAGFGPVARELAPDSPVCASLGRPPRGAHYTSVWSRSDNLVIPADSSQLTWLAPEAGEAEIEDLAGSELRDIVFDDLGHLSLLTSPRVAAAVAERLST